MTLLKGLVGLLVVANAAYFLWARDLRGADTTAEPPRATLRLASEGAAVGDGGSSGERAAAPAAPRLARESAPSRASVAGAAGGTAGGARASGAPPADDPTLLTNVKRCITVGPFADVSQAAHAASTLRSGGYDPRQRVAEGEVWAGVWVYLPLPPTRAGGEQLLARLKAAGVEDALEMPGPGDASVISLGLFSETRRAQARVAQVQALGFNPALADRKRTGDVYWIDIDLKPTDSLVKPSDLTGESGRIVRLEVKGCPVPVSR
ncbi:MAG TPA: hypothetical protein VKT22_07140 [Steroidobacteraceae bacterium]|nr:hypothetical protein [Steroidobacteraceae bacterium]